MEEGFPQVHNYQIESQKEILTMSLLGPNLKSLLSQSGGKFTLKTVMLLALQIIRRIEAVHNQGLLHRDIKPENLVMGMGDDDKTVYLIDFGLAEPYLDSKGRHIPFNRNQNVAGTLNYLSTFAHLGIRASRRDDLISFGYMLIYLVNGNLPWMNLAGNSKEKVHKMCQMKFNLSREILCQDLPQEICDYLNYACDMTFNQKPDYKYIEGLFKKVLENLGAEEDGLFDWKKKINAKGIDLTGRKIMEEGLDKYQKHSIESLSFLDV